MAKKLKSKKAAVDPNLVDYYHDLSLNRNASEKEILEELRIRLNKTRQMERMVMRGSVNHTRLREVEDKIHAATRIFSKKETRVAYDEKLEIAIQNGALNTNAQPIAEDVYAEIERMFEMNNFNGVIHKCQELLSSNSAETKLYTYMARSYLMSDRPAEAIKTAEDCVNIHPNDFDALQLAARFYNMCNNDLQKSQSFVNRMLELDAENPVAINEQGYLYLCMGNRAMAFKTIDEYISAHPTDEYFREAAAVDMINYSYKLFVKDENGYDLLISQEAYEECLAIAEKAASIYNDQDIKGHLDYTRQFGNIEFNQDNKEAIAWEILGGLVYVIPSFMFFGQGGSGIATGILMLLLGLGLIACGVMLFKVSKRPYWQIYRYELTGYRDKNEKIFVTVGKIFTGYMRWGLKAGWALVKFAMRLALPG